MAAPPRQQLPVVALADAPERVVWRCKPADELEAVLIAPTAVTGRVTQASASCPGCTHCCSVSSRERELPWLSGGAVAAAGYSLLRVGIHWQQVRLRSVQRPSQEASLVFLNSTDLPVRVLWLNWDGNEVPYGTL